jgi:hypothetical protein
MYIGLTSEGRALFAREFDTTKIRRNILRGLLVKIIDYAVIDFSFIVGLNEHSFKVRCIATHF